MEDTSGIKQILKQHKLRHTQCRSDILDQFMGTDHARSHHDIESELRQFDRVTIYRTLRTFLDKGLIHKIPDDEGNTRYALCPDKCTTHEHHHEHLHFKCEKCGLTTCMEHYEIPEINVPPGFQLKEVTVLALGICDKCQN